MKLKISKSQALAALVVVSSVGTAVYNTAAGAGIHVNPLWLVVVTGITSLCRSLLPAKSGIPGQSQSGE